MKIEVKQNCPLDNFNPCKQFDYHKRRPRVRPSVLEPAVRAVRARAALGNEVARRPRRRARRAAPRLLCFLRCRLSSVLVATALGVLALALALDLPFF